MVVQMVNLQTPMLIGMDHKAIVLHGIPTVFKSTAVQDGNHVVNVMMMRVEGQKIHIVMHSEIKVVTLPSFMLVDKASKVPG
jgi:hypothetical protein